MSSKTPREGISSARNPLSQDGASDTADTKPQTPLNIKLKDSPPLNHASPLAELRRPSIADIVSSGGLVITQRGSCELKLDNVLAQDVEMMYAYHSTSGRRGSQHSDEQTWAQTINSEDGVSQGGTARSTGCCSVKRDWWTTDFTPVLEHHWKKTVTEFLRRRFRISLMFIALFALLWIVFFSVNIPIGKFPQSTGEAEIRSNELASFSVRYAFWYVIGGVLLFLLVAILLALTFFKYYPLVALPLSLVLAVLLMATSCALAMSFYFDTALRGFLTMALLAQFALTAIVTLMVFTLSRLPFVITVPLCLVYLTVLEILLGLFTFFLSQSYPFKVYLQFMIARVLFYVCLLISGITTAYLSKLRLRATFWKIAQCVLSQKALDLEHELKERTILSMMPKPFATELMDLNVQLLFILKQRVGIEEEELKNLDPKYQCISTPFTIRSMESVTILFADIVGFTEFSAKLSAAELVGVLNDVFSTFDDFVARYNCEKISTLGDCYFCVSGCPEPADDHAENCVDLGLAILDALNDVRSRQNIPIQMRVGIHTGAVYCGVMGTKKFKFDVWSKDVIIANRIESIASPGTVLISAATKELLKEDREVCETSLPHRVPELMGMSFYTVARRHVIPPAISHDSLNQLEDANDVSMAMTALPRSLSRSLNRVQSCVPPTAEEEPQSPLCPPWKRKTTPSPSNRPLATDTVMQPSSSIVDIFSKQKQLHRCTSYAELRKPPTQNDMLSQEEDNMDTKIVELMEEQKVDYDTYFDPKLKIVSLNFHNRDWETIYRDYGRDLDEGSETEMTEMKLGFRITKLSYVIDALSLFVIYLCIMVGSAVCLSSDGTFNDTLWISWLGLFVLGLILELIVILFVLAVARPNWFPVWFSARATFIINFYVRSVVALFMIYYPMTVVCVSIAQCQARGVESVAGLAHVQMAFFVTIVVLVSSINFMEVSYIVKLVGGFLSAMLTVVMVVAVHLDLCISELTPFVNATDASPTNSPTRAYDTESPASYLTTYYTRHVAPESIVLLLLILLLLTVVNRMSEVSARLSFIGRIEASARRRSTRQRKAQADWLLFNIIPPHVAYELRRTGKYSQNHECVGVIFASIVNFTEFNRHVGDTGEEALRLLNEIVSEFDVLLDKPRFSNVEKIKTIGSTYMAASGLALPNDHRPVHHLTELIDLSLKLIDVLEQVNRKTPGFVFLMRIGFNYGTVTSGVVGSRKMLYDIWGDTVNVASRMDSTGLVNKIHMPQQCLQLLAPYVKHEPHKVVNVKGKGEMRTVFVTRNYPSPSSVHQTRV